MAVRYSFSASCHSFFSEYTVARLSCACAERGSSAIAFWNSLIASSSQPRSASSMPRELCASERVEGSWSRLTATSLAERRAACRREVRANALTPPPPSGHAPRIPDGPLHTPLARPAGGRPRALCAAAPDADAPRAEGERQHELPPVVRRAALVPAPERGEDPRRRRLRGGGAALPRRPSLPGGAARAHAGRPGADRGGRPARHAVRLRRGRGAGARRRDARALPPHRGGARAPARARARVPDGPAEPVPLGAGGGVGARARAGRRRRRAGGPGSAHAEGRALAHGAAAGGAARPRARGSVPRQRPVGGRAGLGAPRLGDELRRRARLRPRGDGERLVLRRAVRAGAGARSRRRLPIG